LAHWILEGQERKKGWLKLRRFPSFKKTGLIWKGLTRGNQFGQGGCPWRNPGLFKEGLKAGLFPRELVYLKA